MSENKIEILVARIDERTKHIVETVDEIKDDVHDYPQYKEKVNILMFWKNKIILGIIIAITTGIVSIILNKIK